MWWMKFTCKLFELSAILSGLFQWKLLHTLGMWMKQQLTFPVKSHSVLLPFCPACVGGCQSGFMSSSLELKEVSIMKQDVLASRSGWSMPGVTCVERRPRPEATEQWGSQCHIVFSSSPATCLVIIPSVCWRLGSVSQAGWQWSTTTSTKINFFTNYWHVWFKTQLNRN